MCHFHAFGNIFEFDGKFEARLSRPLSSGFISHFIKDKTEDTSLFGMEISNSSSLQDGRECVHWKCAPFTELSLCA